MAPKHADLALVDRAAGARCSPPHRKPPHDQGTKGVVSTKDGTPIAEPPPTQASRHQVQATRKPRRHCRCFVAITAWKSAH